MSVAVIFCEERVALAEASLLSCLHQSFQNVVQNDHSAREARDAVRLLLWKGIEWSISGESFMDRIERVSPDAIVAVEFPASRRGDEPITLIGKVSRFQVGPADHLFSITDRSGKIHVLAPSRRYKVKELDPTRDQMVIDQGSRFEVERTPLDHDEVAIRRAICAGLSTHAENPLFQKLRKTVEKAYILERRKKLLRLSGCMLMLPANAADVAYFAPHRIRARDSGQLDWVSEHGSNFFEGLSMLSVFHCFLGKTLRDPNRSLAIALGADILGNIWEDIELPSSVPQHSLPGFSTAGQTVHTDLDDFQSGVLGALAYLVAVKTIEQGVGALRGFSCGSAKFSK